MSAQAGILFFDRRPVPSAVVDALDRGIAGRGPHGGARYVENGVALVFRAFHISREDRLERQPQVSRTGRVMTWDGRLDNRDDLLNQVGRGVEGTPTDVALAMASYERWGDAGLARLIGDWSLTIWDPATRVLRLASDYMGPRPLYYHLNAERIVWSSSLETVVRLANCEDDLEQRYIAGLLLAGPPRELTPYRNVYSVPTAGSVHVDAQGHSRRVTFWDYQAGSIRYKDDAAYEEHLRHVFREAIRSRLRVDGPVCAELSGGWDSSTVVCMAHEVMRETPVQARALHTISYVSFKSEEANERKFIEAVEEHCGLDGRHVNADDHPYVPSPTWVSPVDNSNLVLRMREVVHARGARLVLTGRVGDATMGAQGDCSGSLADLIMEGRVVEYLRQARAWSLATRKPFVQIVPQSMRPLLPRRVRMRLRWNQISDKSRRGWHDRDHSFGAVFAISPTLARDFSDVYGDEHAGTSDVWPPSKRDLLVVLRDSSARRRFVVPDAEPRVEFTHPYVDRRLVEFVMAIPTSQWCRPNEPRSLMRRAFSTMLPEPVARRFSKGHARPTIVRVMQGLTKGWAERLHELEVVRHGYVSTTALANRLQMSTGPMWTGNLGAIVRLEAWLTARRLQSARSSGQSRMDVPGSPVETSV